MSATATWQELLKTPHPCDHFVQLYTDDRFLARAVSHFIGTGLAVGEAAVIIAIPAHLALFAAHLEDVPGALDRRQLVWLEAEPSLATFMVDGMPDRVAFRALAAGMVDRVRSAGYHKIRLYGEMVDLLWPHNLEASVRLEEMWNEVLDDEQVSLLCAYRIDNFDRYAHRSVLLRVSETHSHLIPVDDYQRFDQAVSRAYADVFGPQGDAEALRDVLVSRFPSEPAMPPAQAALIALRGIDGRTADAVLERARDYYRS
jgi:hypothetical protein